MLRMKILNQLNGRQREEVRQLENLCTLNDNNQSGVPLTAEEDAAEAPLFFLSYEEERLAGFGIMYVLEDKTAEVIVYVHPEFRKHNIYKKMAAAMKKEAERMGVGLAYIVHDPYAWGEMEILDKNWNFKYSHSEYLMEWKYSYPLLPTNTILVEPLPQTQLSEAATLMAGVFPMQEGAAGERIQQLTGEGAVYYGAWQKEELVGVFCLSIGRESVYVFDFAIDGDCQGRGFGKAMLKEMIRLVQKEDAQRTEKSVKNRKIRIQVSSKNEMAFRMYQKNGFQVISQRDYYQVLWQSKLIKQA